MDAPRGGGGDLSLYSSVSVGSMGHPEMKAGERARSKDVGSDDDVGSKASKPGGGEWGSNGGRPFGGEGGDGLDAPGLAE